MSSTSRGGITPVQTAPRPIDPGLRIGHVHLRTADIDRVKAFYVGVLGFDVVLEARDVPGWGTTGDVLFLAAGGYHHHLGFNTWKSAGGERQPDGVTGLHHVALNYPTRAGLADAVRRLRDADWPLRQLSDHGTIWPSTSPTPTATTSSWRGTGRCTSGRATSWGMRRWRWTPGSTWRRCSPPSDACSSGLLLPGSGLGHPAVQLRLGAVRYQAVGRELLGRLLPDAAGGAGDDCEAPGARGFHVRLLPDVRRARTPGTAAIVILEPTAVTSDPLPIDISAARGHEAATEAASARARVRTARFSVLAACFLVAIKLVTGLLTGSLGLLAEAAHSGTDLVAALLTLFALRVAVRPADEEHQYGHGKAEHLAALGESAFLALVSAFIGYLALHRLLSGDARAVDAQWWALAVLGVVIAVDASRALVSLRASRRYGSAALAANALHFASDLGGSLAVLVGLIFVSAGYHDADSIAALVVAVLVIFAAVRLASDSVQVLMDRAPAEAQEAIERALAELDSRVQVRRVRTRQAAGRNFVDLVIGIAPDAGITQAHTTADDIEGTVHRTLPNTDVLVHVEPLDAEGDLRARATAAALTAVDVREVHNVRVMHVGDGYELSLHAKLPSGQTLDAAHSIVCFLEDAVRAAVPELSRIYTHIEPLSGTDWTTKPAGDEVSEERRVIDAVVRHHTGAAPVEVRFRDSETGRIALVTVGLPGEQPLQVAHRRAGLIEGDVRGQRPELADVIVHTEPCPPAAPESAPDA